MRMRRGREALVASAEDARVGVRRRELNPRPPCPYNRIASPLYADSRVLYPLSYAALILRPPPS